MDTVFKRDQVKILRVFPARTSFTPADELVAIGEPALIRPKADEVHISVLFTWDLEESQRLAGFWSRYYDVVKTGGPAYGGANGFFPGRYVKPGITFTTRGCNFNCPWCLVPEKEGRFKTLETIAPGNIVQDNNILFSHKAHLRKVFRMLMGQRQVEFKGGLDCRLLKDWHIDALRGLRISEIWLALDSWDTLKHFEKACVKLRNSGFKRDQIRCYVLAGFKEPIQDSEERLEFAYKCGALPFIQLYQNNSKQKRMAGEASRDDNLFVRKWSRPAAIKTAMKAKGL